MTRPISMDLRERAMARLAAEQCRPDVARRRTRWKRHQKRVDPRRLVFIDETWAPIAIGPTWRPCAAGPPEANT